MTVTLVVGGFTLSVILLFALAWLIVQAHMATERHERTDDDD